MVEIRIQGVAEEAATVPVETELGVGVKVKDAVRVSAARAAADAVTVHAEPDDLVELQLEDGAILWFRADDLGAQVGAAEAGRGEAASPDVVSLGTSLPLADRTRGLADWAIAGLRILGVDLPARGAEALGEAYDGKAVAKPGLYHWHGGSPSRLFEAAAAGDKPWLVFIHGTASNTEGSFGDLVRHQPGTWQELERTYAGRILAFEHHTLTESPVDNALQLARALPRDAKVHLVSHSRGGLVGEILGRGRLMDAQRQPRAAFDSRDLGRFGDDEVLKLTELNELLARQRLHVSRFVRVACPARGTSLMGGKLDRWLNLFFNGLGFAMGGRLNPVASELLGGLKALVRGIVKARAEPSALPGLAVMSPELSPLLQVLNRPDVLARDGLQVISGDIEKGKKLLPLLVWFSDLYFGGEHDLVVDTASMDGGAPRVPAREPFLDRGSGVSHFNYFFNRSSADVLRQALSAAPGPADVGVGLSRAASEKMPKLETRGRGQVPVVFVLPGISGTHLKVGGRRIWIDLLQLARGGVGKLAIGSGRVEPDELVARYYGDLCLHLSTSHDVRPWPYDWRRSIFDTAALFARDFGKALDKTDRPVRIVAHSMGGLVARAALAQDAELRQRFSEREGCRLVMLGTPNGGSFSIPMLLLGRNRMMRWLAMLDIEAGGKDQLAVVAAWPGAVQMLPEVDGSLHATGGHDLFTGAGWQALRKLDPDGSWSAPGAPVLADARRLRGLLDAAGIDRERMLYVAGQADTYASLEVDGNRIVFGVTGEGDGQVLWKTGIPQGMQAWYCTAVHGDLARHSPIFPAILDLLQRGTTELLPQTRPPLSRPRGAPASVEREAVPVVASEDQLLAAALGASPWEPPKVVKRVAVRVVHGHLKHASHPVVVGHYIGDTLNGSELTLDREQKGRISRRRARGLHPGPIGTFEVHLDGKQQPPGSVVVGLGEVSELTVGTLAQTLRRGLMALASAMDERDERAGEEGDSSPPQGRGFSCVLVGSGAGVVAIGDCVVAVLRAVRGANIELAEKGFTEVEIIETVEQRAINAWHAIARRIGSAELKDVFVMGGEIKRGKGAWRQIGPDYDPDWWTPVTIRAAGPRDGEDQEGGAPPVVADEGALHYVVLSGRARAEAFMVGTRRSFIDCYLQEIAKLRMAEGARSPARTLFELLWPNRLKEHSLDDRNIRLCLDTTAAALPWEMMDDRRPWLVSGEGGLGAEQGPPAVRHGVIRQLVGRRIREVVCPAQGRRKALVVGDPRGAGSPLHELPGAQDEALAVKAALERRGYDVTLLIGDRADARPEDVVSALFSEAWEIIHIAAHGVVDHKFINEPSAEAKTGIVLGGSSETMVLDSRMLEQMPVTPELVFINCCHVGRIKPTAETEFARSGRPGLAASVAAQLIGMGARAVVAAGWEVSDTLASLFATKLYDGLLAGESYGQAVREARAAAYEADRSSTTWGAYQCYGHPDFRLPQHEESRRHPAEQPVYAAPCEAVSSIQRIVAMAGVGGERDAEADRAELDRIEQAVAALGWLADAEVRYELARAYADLKEYDKAIDHYAAAAAGEEPRAPLVAVEQLHNLRARRAAKSMSKAPAPEISQAISSLRAVITACGPSQERLSLIGSAYKRLAQVHKDEGKRTEALRLMEEAYREARELGQERGNNNVYYPWSQELTAKVIVALRDGKPPPRDFDTLQRSLRPASAHDFWQRILPADLRLLELVADGALSVADREEIVSAYRKVWKDTGSRRELDSINDQVDFLIAMVQVEGQPRTEFCDSLRVLKTRLEEVSHER